MKKRTILASIMTIVLCVCLISGSTFALFTSTSEANIAISAGTVNVSATIDTAMLKTWSLGETVDEARTDGTYANKGSFAEVIDGELILTNILPGDSTQITIDVDNKSNVSIAYRVRMTVEGELADALVATAAVNGVALQFLPNNVTEWVYVEAPKAEIDDIVVTVEFPDADNVNKYHGKQSKVLLAVEAVQGNAYSYILVNDKKYDDAVSAFDAAVDGDTVTFHGTQVPFIVDKNVNVVLDAVELFAVTENQNAITIADGITANVTLKGENRLVGAKNGSAIYVGEDATLNLTGNTLVAIGNNGYEYFTYNDDNVTYSNTADASYNGKGGSGIGGKGTINITKVASLTALGYGLHAFGIGGASAAVTVTDSTVEYARGGYANDEMVYLESWGPVTYGKKEPEGGAAIGSSVDRAVITVDGSTVKMAEGGSKSAGIGATFHTGIDVVIKNSNVTAVGGNSSAAIGGSRVINMTYADSVAANEAVNVTVTKSTVNAKGGQYAAGIGAGYDTYCSPATIAPTTTVNIDAGSNVNAKGGLLGAGIGGGHNVINVTCDVKCDLANVKAGDGVDSCCFSTCTAPQAVGLGAMKITAFPDEFGYTVVKDESEFNAAMKANEKIIKVILSADVTVDIGSANGYYVGGADTEEVILDLGGKKWTIDNKYRPYIILVNPEAKLTIVNGTVESTKTSGTWDTYDINFNGGMVTVENVTFNNAVAIDTDKEATFTNVTINESHDYYALWITAEGQTVTLNNVTINSAGRAIKVADEYVSAPEKIVLNITDCKFTSVNKAAVLVSSVAGAEINVEDLDISEVASDTVNVAWKDNKKSEWQNASVTVNGVECIVAP